MGFHPGPVDGQMGRLTRSAANKWRAGNDTERAKLLPGLNSTTAMEWCRTIGLLKVNARYAWPATRSLKVYPAGREYREIRAYFKELDDAARKFFRTKHNVRIAGRYDIVLGWTKKQMLANYQQARKDRGLDYQHAIKLRHINCNGKIVSALAIPGYIFVCWPIDDQESADSFRFMKQKIAAILVHEIMHQIQYEYSRISVFSHVVDSRSKILGPLWMIEGTAVYFQNQFVYDDVKGVGPSLRLQTYRLRNENKDLRSLTAPKSVHDRIGYKISGFATGLLAMRYGDQALFDYWKNFAVNKRQNASFRATFDMGLNEFLRLFSTLSSDVDAAEKFVSGP